MAAISDLLLLILSFGAFDNLRKDYFRTPRDESSFDNMKTTPTIDFKSTSLYDLMQHFPVDNDIECSESDSRFRLPGQCTRYVTCRNFEAYVRSCPPGMYFDQIYGHCRLAFEVDCDGDSPPSLECGMNEEYYLCGTSCEKTCNNMHKNLKCEYVCEEGCKCRIGYVRNRSGKCVNPEACDYDNSLISLLESF